MRIAKVCFLVSISVFLLALSYALLSGDLLRPSEAKAQFGSPVVSVVRVNNDNDFLVVLENGDAIGFPLNGGSGAVSGWSLGATKDLGNIAGGPVGNTFNSVGTLKSGYGGADQR